LVTTAKSHRRSALHSQLCWFITLRWIAGLALAAGAILEWRFAWFGAIAGRFAAVAIVIFLYNLAISRALPRVRRRRMRGGLALAQLLLDMVALTALIVWTGGIRSPLIAFFVFHMVFASLLLTRAAAYASAAAGCFLIACGLALSHQWPGTRSELFSLLGIVMTLVLTVMLTNRITRDLRAHRRRLVRQNRRIVAMSRQLREQQQALVQHEKMVAMGRMAAGVTHEIANPLACIDSLLQLAQRRPERMNAETVEKLRDQVQRINQIIQQMKAFAHPTEVVAQQMPLNDIVEQAIAMVRFDPRLKKTDLRREFDPSSGVVSMSPQALQQVVINLIINALDAMAATESPVLTLRTQRRDGWCAVEVADNGHGIDPQHMPRLFEPFFTTKPVGKGTGLGLSISYSLMQRQGGSISVRSQSRRGTTFTLRLPANEPRSRPREPAAAMSSAGENSAS
jgi:signal transduction histidine kinase